MFELLLTSKRAAARLSVISVASLPLSSSAVVVIAMSLKDMLTRTKGVRKAGLLAPRPTSSSLTSSQVRSPTFKYQGLIFKIQNSLLMVFYILVF